jgi:hypothetical protein
MPGDCSSIFTTSTSFVRLLAGSSTFTAPSEYSNFRLLPSPSNLTLAGLLAIPLSVIVSSVAWSMSWSYLPSALNFGIAKR